MAKADYICCEKCGTKLIYDGYDTVYESLVYRFFGEHAFDKEAEHRQGFVPRRIVAKCEKCSGSGRIEMGPNDV